MLQKKSRLISDIVKAKFERANAFAIILEDKFEKDLKFLVYPWVTLNSKVYYLDKNYTSNLNMRSNPSVRIIGWKSGNYSELIAYYHDLKDSYKK